MSDCEHDRNPCPQCLAKEAAEAIFTPEQRQKLRDAVKAVTGEQERE